MPKETWLKSSRESSIFGFDKSHASNASIAAKHKNAAKYHKLPFDLCALSLQPYEHPVATPDGTIFELENIVPYVQRHAKNPVTGEPLRISDMLKLNISKNGSGEYFCPVTLKTFTAHSHVVCNRATGNVYSFDAHQALNMLHGDLDTWKDPVNDTPMCSADLLVLQDPQNSNRNVSEFFHVKQKTEASDSCATPVEKHPLKSAAAAKSALNIVPFENEAFFCGVRGAAQITIKTSVGPLHVETFGEGVDAARAAFNFVTLASSGRYSDAALTLHAENMALVCECASIADAECVWGGRTFLPCPQSNADCLPRGTLALVSDAGGAFGSSFAIFVGAAVPFVERASYFPIGSVVRGVGVLDSLVNVLRSGGSCKILSISVKNNPYLSCEPKHSDRTRLKAPLSRNSSCPNRDNDDLPSAFNYY